MLYTCKLMNTPCNYSLPQRRQRLRGTLVWALTGMVVTQVVTCTCLQCDTYAYAGGWCIASNALKLASACNVTPVKTSPHAARVSISLKVSVTTPNIYSRWGHPFHCFCHGCCELASHSPMRLMQLFTLLHALQALTRPKRLRTDHTHI